MPTAMQIHILDYVIEYIRYTESWDDGPADGKADVSAICNQTEKKNEKSKKKNDRHKKIRENPRVPEAIQCGSEHLWNKTDELLFCR